MGGWLNANISNFETAHSSSPIEVEAGQDIRFSPIASNRCTKYIRKSWSLGLVHELVDALCRLSVSPSMNRRLVLYHHKFKLGWSPHDRLRQITMAPQK